MTKCAKCGRNLGIFSEKYYTYPGKKKGSLEITDEKIICTSCFFQNYNENEDLSQKKIHADVLKIRYMMEGNYSECLKILESIFDKGNPADWYSKGNLLWNLGKREEALKCYDEALFLDTHYVKAWYRKGFTLLFMRKYEDAKKCFINVITCSPEVREGKPAIVKGEIKGWALAAMLGAAIALAKQKKPKVKPVDELIKLVKAGKEFEKAQLEVYKQVVEENPFYAVLLTIIADLPPLEYCVQNFLQVLKFLEPSEIAVFSLLGRKH